MKHPEGDPGARDVLASDGRELNDGSRRSGAHSRQRVWLATSFATASVTVLVLLLGHSSEGVKSLGLAEQLQSAESPSEVRDLAHEAYESFAGSTRQQNAGYVLRAWVQNHAMDECLAEAGFPDWDWSLSRVYAQPTDPLSAGSWLAEPHRLATADLLVSQRERILAESIMNRDDIPPDEDEAIGGCLEQVVSASETDAEAAAVPSSASDLMVKWQEMVEQVAYRAGGDLASYETCVDEMYVPMLDDSGLPLSAAPQRLESLMPGAEHIPTPHQDPETFSSVWQRFVDAERSLAEADWTCRRTVYEAHVRDLVPAIEEFVSANRDQILAAKHEWIEVESKAEALGFVGQAGPLGK